MFLGRQSTRNDAIISFIYRESARNCIAGIESQFYLVTFITYGNVGFFDNDLTLNERVDSTFLKVISIYVWLSEKMSISSDLNDGSNTLLLTLIRLAGKPS